MRPKAKSSMMLETRQSSPWPMWKESKHLPNQKFFSTYLSTKYLTHAKHRDLLLKQRVESRGKDLLSHMPVAGTAAPPCPFLLSESREWVTLEQYWDFSQAVETYMSQVVLNKNSAAAGSVSNLEAGKMVKEKGLFWNKTGQEFGIA